MEAKRVAPPRACVRGTPLTTTQPQRSRTIAPAPYAGVLLGTQTMTADHKDDVPDERTSPSPPHSSSIDQIRESEGLEELIREETIRHLAAAWEAQRRLARACFTAREKNAESGR
jgi:hypothetical protein